MSYSDHVGRLAGKPERSVLSCGVGLIVTSGGPTALGSVDVSWNTTWQELLWPSLCTLPHKVPAVLQTERSHICRGPNRRNRGCYHPFPTSLLPWMNKAEELQTFQTSTPHRHVRHRATIFQAGILFGLPHWSCRVCHAIGSFFLWNQTHSTRNDPLLRPSLITDLALVMMFHWIISWGPFWLGLSYSSIVKLGWSFTGGDRKAGGLLKAGNYNLPAGKGGRARQWKQVWVFCSVFQSGVFGIVCICGRSTGNSILFWRVQWSSTVVVSPRLSTSAL